MVRTAIGLGVLAVLLVAAGCRMCSHPYDYCGPVYYGRGCQSCSSYSRAGSILSGSPTAAQLPELAQRPVQAPQKALSRASLQGQLKGDMRLGDVPGSEQIVSVTERVVDPSAAANESQQVAGEPSAETTPLLPSKGWTARRPTPEVRR